MAFKQFLVEDGTGVVGANSYVDYSYFLDYCEYYSNDVLGDMDEEEFEKLAIRASRWLDQQLKWKSTKLNPDQGLAFPRVGFGLPDIVKEVTVTAISVLDSGVDLYKQEKTLTAQAFGDTSESYKGSYVEDGVPSILKEVLSELRSQGYGAKGFSQIPIVRG